MDAIVGSTRQNINHVFLDPMSLEELDEWLSEMTPRGDVSNWVSKWPENKWLVFGTEHQIQSVVREWMMRDHRASRVLWHCTCDCAPYDENLCLFTIEKLDLESVDWHPEYDDNVRFIPSWQRARELQMERDEREYQRRRQYELQVCGWYPGDYDEANDDQMVVFDSDFVEMWEP